MKNTLHNNVCIMYDKSNIDSILTWESILDTFLGSARGVLMRHSDCVGRRKIKGFKTLSDFPNLGNECTTYWQKISCIASQASFINTCWIRRYTLLYHQTSTSSNDQTLNNQIETLFVLSFVLLAKKNNYSLQSKQFYVLKQNLKALHCKWNTRITA